MKKFLFALTVLSAGCQQDAQPGDTASQPLPVTTVTNLIPDTLANRMIASYINSMGNSDTNVKAWVIDASGFRRLLEDTSVVAFKIMLAHREEFIASHGAGTPAGYSNLGLTIVAAGVDHNGHYVLPATNACLDVVKPCPPNCPEGSAGSDFLPH